MEFEKIVELMERLEKSNLTALEVMDGDFSLRLEKNVQAVNVVSAPSAAVCATPVAPREIEVVSQKAPEGKMIKSPIVGTFYAASAPDAAPFVSVGQSVKKGDVLCIVEAMKMMNEIESDTDGIISEILCQNGDVVEFGQALFIIK
jgi:acetyl-CoA carboxylase biotin carboxyl carrier protein